MLAILYLCTATRRPPGLQLSVRNPTTANTVGGGVPTRKHDDTCHRNGATPVRIYAPGTYTGSTLQINLTKIVLHTFSAVVAVVRVLM